MIQLIAIDLDGTLLSPDKTISPANKQALLEAEAAGVHVVICTGRPLSGVRPIFEEIGFKSNHSYSVINNGCTTVNSSDWSVITYDALSEEDLVYLDQLTHETHPQLSLFDLNRYIIFNQEPSEIAQMDASIVSAVPVSLGIRDVLEAQPIFQGMFIDQKELIDAFQETYEEALAQRFHTIRSQPILFEILPKGVNKATGLKALAEHLGIPREQIMAIGDENNDIEMIEYAGLGVAMGNAPDTIKALADVTTTSNEEDGVATAIKRYVLQAQN